MNRSRIKILIFLCLLSTTLFAQEGLVSGLAWDDDAYNQQPLKINYDVVPQGLPAQHSLKQFCPPVINQGTSNTAVAWATAWYARTMLDAIACNKTGAAFQEAYNGFFNHRLLVDDCAQPVTLTAMLQSLQQHGAKKFKEFKEVCPDSVGGQVMQSALSHRLSGAVRLFQTFDAQATKVNAIKASLYSGNPVVIGTIHKPSLDLAKEVWQITEQRSRGKGGHAFCVVGYDDAKFGGAFEVVNSFGKSWGKNGFTWIKYEDVQEAVLYGFELFDTQYAECTSNTLEAQVQFVKTDGEIMEGAATGFGSYALSDSYPNRTEFKIKVSATHRMYVYGLFADLTYSMFNFLPMQGQPFTNAFTTAQQQVELPLGNFPFTLEPPTGTNHFIFVFSAAPLDVEELSKKVAVTPGSISQRVSELAKGRKIPKSISWSNEMKFTSGFENDFFIVMTIKMEQVE
jgi:hypothetical protein